MHKYNMAIDIYSLRSLRGFVAVHEDGTWSLLLREGLLLHAWA